jgi:hypothetical protein
MKNPKISAGLFLAGGFAARLAQLGKQVPPGFIVVVQPPFVVIGEDDMPDFKSKWAKFVLDLRAP